MPTDKVQLLIENKVVAFSEPNFRVLKQNFPNLHIYLLENHELAFSKGFQSFLLGSDDINLVMRSLTLNINTKLHILNTMDDGLIIDNSSLADICCSLYADQPYVSLRFEVLLAMIRHNNSIAKRIQLLMKHIHNTDNE